MSADAALDAGGTRAIDPNSYASAVLNILDDFGEEKARLGEVQKAMLNILEDSGGEKLRLEAAQKAALNILDDFGEEKARLADVQKAMLNILEDSGAEKLRLEAAQKVALNILEDFDAEKKKVERANTEMAREIAERKQAQEALRQAKAAVDATNKELEAFSYSVSHDLRAPLRAIDGFSQALIEDYSGQLDENGRHYLQRMREGAQRMAHLIDDMLKLSRVTRTELRREDVDLSALAREIASELFQTKADREVEFAISTGLKAEGDPRLLKIALENLLGNAWKFTGPRPRPRIEFGAYEEGGERVFFVRDDGVGFDMAYSGKLFGAFQRLHDTREFPGTGIGLATVQRVISKHGGRIWAKAEVDKGSTFYFTLK